MSTANEPHELPELRPELRLLEGARGAGGEPSWLVHDPVQNRFIQIDATAYEALRHWGQCRSVDELVARADAAGAAGLDTRSVEGLVDFLFANQLTVAPKSSGWRYFVGHRTAGHRSAWSSLLHNYLFVRVPLCRPQVFLERTLPIARFLASPALRIAIALMGLVGLYLASRQWDQFAAGIADVFTWEGVLVAAVALLLVKVLHEMGHAYMAVHFGCRVHSMGVAFMLMAPMPYTDVTDAWRLTDRRRRLLIDSAGVIVEVAVAVIALLLWSFLPEGGLRSAVFLLCAVSLASSLAINLNPFMRFDGYYLLCELVHIENLQERAFGVGRWKLREFLFGLGLPCPEELPRRTIGFLAVYAWAVWIYRLVLFFGIALLVYHFFFKVLGIILFIVEIYWFIARPVFDECRSWVGLGPKVFAKRRTKISLALGASAIVLCLVPWSTTVEIPAVMERAQMQMLVPTRPAKIVQRHVAFGAVVRSGDPIVTLEAPEIEQELERARTSLRLARLQHARRLADAIDRESSLVLESTITALVSRIEGLERERAELTIVAPFDGRVVDIGSEIHVGRWVGPRDLIAVVASDIGAVARGYVAEADLWRIAEGTAGKFIPEHPQRSSTAIKIDQIARAGAAQIEIADLASPHAGRIAVAPDEKRRAIPTASQYLVHMSVEEPVLHDLSYRGVVLARGSAQSLIARLWRQTTKVLLRESGF
jgi:putative peptide zinc metalloprotease protein